MQSEISEYAAIRDQSLIDDILAHIRANHDTLRTSIARARPVTADELEFIRPHAALRARRGIPLAEFMHAYRIGLAVIWEVVLDVAAGDEAATAAALESAAGIMDYVDHASTHAAEAYIEAQQLLVAEGDRVRRDLLEDLLAGREPAPGPRQAAARAAGLDPATRCIMVLGVPVAEPPDELALRSAAALVSRELGGPVPPLAVARREEIVVVCAIGEREAQVLAAPLQRAWNRLADDGTVLAIGVSTPQSASTGLGAAYRDALAAIELLPADGGVLFLPDVRLFDFLTMRPDETALRLVRPHIRRFVEEDAAGGGALIKTLLEYVAADMNARVAAERLFVHVNTAYQRLERIAEKTGLDLRRFADVQELLAAIKLLRAKPPV
jgi:sugar diacid utilization regulator